MTVNIPRSYDLDMLASGDVRDVQDARRIRRRYDLDYLTNHQHGNGPFRRRRTDCR